MTAWAQSLIRISNYEVETLQKRLAEITAAQTGKSVEQINADGDRDRWFTAEEALEYGFVDHIREHAADVTGGGGTEN